MARTLTNAIIGMLLAVVAYVLVIEPNESTARVPRLEYHHFQDPGLCPSCNHWVNACLGDCDGTEDCCALGAEQGVVCEGC